LQCNIQKIWQTHGCSSNYLKGVALFLKKDKAILLLVGTIFKLPLGLRFKVVSCTYFNPYFVRICGEMFSRLVDTDIDQEDQSNASNIVTRDMEITCVHSGSLAWPTIWWDMISLFGVMLAIRLSYVHPIIPPPLNTCVCIISTFDELLFGPPTLLMSGEDGSRYLTSLEYDELIRDAKDISSLATFAHSLVRLHQLKDEIQMQHNKDSHHELVLSQYWDGIPHDYKKELSFLGEINHCIKQIHHTTRFHYGMMKHLYPHGNVQDRYMHVPLIPRDEASTEGMMLTNASILEVLALLVKKPNGKYVLGENH
jgi:hypothetical protein